MATRDDRERALYIISVAAELAGVHAQTLRIYERKGLIEPERTEGGSRRYSDNDIALLRRIQELTNEGVSLVGVRKVLALEAELERARCPDRRAPAVARRRARRARAGGRGRAPRAPPRPRAGAALDGRSPEDRLGLGFPPTFRRRYCNAHASPARLLAAPLAAVLVAGGALVLAAAPAGRGDRRRPRPSLRDAVRHRERDHARERHRCCIDCDGGGDARSRHAATAPSIVRRRGRHRDRRRRARLATAERRASTSTANDAITLRERHVRPAARRKTSAGVLDAEDG